MDKLRVQVNGRGYYLVTDKPDEVLSFAKTFEQKILYITSKMRGITEAEATALSALLIMGDSLKKKRNDEDQALIDELNGKIEILEERADMLSSEITAHNDAESAFRNEITSLREREQELLSRLSAANEKEAKLTSACSDSENALNDTKSALASANKIIAQLNTEKFTEVAANEALRKELEASQGRLEAANKIIAELNGKLTNMEINVIAENGDNPTEAEYQKVKSEKEELEIELAIAYEEIETLKNAGTPADESEMAKKIAEYERKIKQLESRGGEIDKLRGILAETEHSVRQKVNEKEEENQKLRNILKNYENSYGTAIAKKEEEILELQRELEELRAKVSDENSKSKFVQTTFDS